jgi:thiol:disulfide interchange protein
MRPWAERKRFRAAPVSVVLLATILGLLTGFGSALAILPQDSSPLGGGPLGSAPTVHVWTAWSTDGVHPGDRAILAIVVDMEPGFHINPDKAQVVPVGDFTPYPTSVRVTAASEALGLESVRFPEPEVVHVEYAEGDLRAFSGRNVFYLPVKVAEGASPGPVHVGLEVEYQACNATLCLPPNTDTFDDTLMVSGGDVPVRPANQALFAGFTGTPSRGSGGPVGFDLFGWSFSVNAGSSLGFLLLLVVALIGGMLLNFTPCVLPVIPIKILSLSNVAGSRARMLTLGIAMSLGVVGFWLGLGGLIAAVSSFTATNQLFQYPAFTIGVGLIIAFMAVAMTGVFVIRLPGFVYALNPGQESIHGSFGFGIMTAVLSTPCTAPFMGAAAAWAATQSAGTTLTTFAAIGAGMALPYFALSASPELVKKMPRSGPASELIKQVMGLLMLAAAAYFVGVGLSAIFDRPPDPPSRLYWWVVMAFVAAAGIWLAIRTIRIASAPAKRVGFAALGVLLLAGSSLGAVRLTDEGPIPWVHYTPERFDRAIRNGKVVVMDFTAEWCLNCKSLEHGVLNGSKVVSLFADGDVVPIKVDITGNNPQGKAKLKEVGRLTIPLLVVYAPDGREVFKSDFYTADEVLQAVNEARGMSR